MLCRTKEHVIATSTSADGGYSWTPLKPSGLYAPNSGIDGVSLADGRQLLVYNHRDDPEHTRSNRGDLVADDWRSRWPLNVALSPDGVSWQMRLTLEDEPRKDGYAYPAVIQTRDHLVHIVYTWDRVKIKHVIIDPARLE
jgi:predicted neuraminidase